MWRQGLWRRWADRSSWKFGFWFQPRLGIPTKGRLSKKWRTKEKMQKVRKKEVNTIWYILL